MKSSVNPSMGASQDYQPTTESSQPIKEQRDTGVYSSGTPVKISKGSFRGCIGQVAACTNDGVFFIRKHSDPQQDRCDRMPNGPFLDDEFEYID
ncbi:hypothetical protein [Acaryochloris thomasi]|nr:hypothetical protein [Acaryochloris thomasi]